MVRAGEDCSIAFIIATDLHTPVPTGVEEHVQLVLAIARQDDGLFPHARLEVIARFRHLALVADKEPDAGENAFLLLLVNSLVDKDLSADHPCVEIDPALYGVGLGRHSYTPPAP